MTDGLRRELSWLAAQVADVLKTVDEPDERELLEEHYERELNSFMHAGFGGPIPPAVLQLVRPAAPAAQVIDLTARRGAIV